MIPIIVCSIMIVVLTVWYEHKVNKTKLENHRLKNIVADKNRVIERYKILTDEICDDYDIVQDILLEYIDEEELNSRFGAVKVRSEKFNEMFGDKINGKDN